MYSSCCYFSLVLLPVLCSVVVFLLSVGFVCMVFCLFLFGLICASLILFIEGRLVVCFFSLKGELLLFQSLPKFWFLAAFKSSRLFTRLKGFVSLAAVSEFVCISY